MILACWLVAAVLCACGSGDPQTGSGTNPEAGVPVVLPVVLAVDDGKASDEALTNSIGMQILWCPQGSFVIGSPDGERYRIKDEAQTAVEFSRGFWLGKTEVTQGEWKAVMGGGSNPSSFKTSDRHPVENVTWEDAMEFCRKLTQRERAAGVLPEGWAYTLPTEAQWEYACRAGTKDPYAAPVGLMAWHKGNSFQTTHPAGKRSYNPWGFFDMHGNVWEWCRDHYASPYAGGLDPKGPKNGTQHVTRGGGWNEDARYCRSAFRSFPGRLSLRPTRGTIGFRVALERDTP